MSVNVAAVAVLVFAVGLVAVAVIAAVGLLVVQLVHQLDRLVNGWGDGPGGPGDDDFDDPPPEDPTGHGLRLPRTLGELLAGGPVPPVPPQRGDVPSVDELVAASAAAKLRHLAGATVADLAAYADPVPGHDRDCGCPDCVDRLVDAFAARATDDVVAAIHNRQARPPDPDPQGGG